MGLFICRPKSGEGRERKSSSLCEWGRELMHRHTHTHTQSYRCTDQIMHARTHTHLFSLGNENAFVSPSFVSAEKKARNSGDVIATVRTAFRSIAVWNIVIKFTIEFHIVSLEIK